MIEAHYIDDTGRHVSAELWDWDALTLYVEGLVKAPIDLEYVHFETSSGIVGTFNLNTFEVC